MNVLSYTNFPPIFTVLLKHFSSEKNNDRQSVSSLKPGNNTNYMESISLFFFPQALSVKCTHATSGCYIIDGPDPVMRPEASNWGKFVRGRALHKLSSACTLYKTCYKLA